MAGSLGYSLKVANIYQRRFDAESFAMALADSHLYIISRRPTLRIDPNSVRVYEDRITFDALTKKSIRSTLDRRPLVMPLEAGLEIEDFRTYSNCTYFSFRANGILVHGDAWALASLADNASPDLATQEVLYIGQAYGRDGTNNSWQRTRRHSTLQRIYEEHSGEDWGVFISPLVIVRSDRSSDDHIDDEEEATLNILGLNSNDSFYDRHRRVILGTSIDLIEHALISYFVPPYNELLKEWRPDRPTVAMTKMKSEGFRLLQVYLDGWRGLARYYTAQTKPDRSHLVLVTTESDPYGRGGQVVYDPAVHNWRLELIVMHYKELLNSAETSAAVLNIFGDEAPRIRRPPEVVLPGERHDWSLDQAKENYATLCGQIIEYEGPGLDPTTGLVGVGQYADGHVAHWQLMQPRQGVCHGTIAGPKGTGKTNVLNILRTEAICTGIVGLILIDPTGRHNSTAWRPYTYEEADNFEASVDLLARLSRAVLARRKVGNYLPSVATPGILVTVEDAHVLFSKSSQAARRANIIAQFGESVGVGLVVTVPDLNIARFGNLHSLRTALRKHNTVVFGPPDAYEMLAEGDGSGD